jgi:P4 family phage/plasmid primase-like protien
METVNTMNESPNNPTIVAELRKLLGDAVMIPIKTGEKGPKIKGWQETTLEKMSEPGYLKRLALGNIGVLLGKPSSGLCSIDIDTDDQVEPFLDLNPKLKQSLRTQGARGANVWVRILGEFPRLTPLTQLQTHDGAEKPVKWGEWRATGGQTVIYGKHPSGCQYQILNRAAPVEIEFEDIVWPDTLDLPWNSGLYKELVQKEGEAFERSTRGKIQLNQRFFVAKFAEEHVVLHEPEEKAFYRYNEIQGIWKPESIDFIKNCFAHDLKAYADSQFETQIERFRTNASLTGLSEMLRGKVEKRNAFAGTKEVIHLGNGMLHLETRPPELREYSPQYFSRNQCPISLVEGSDCPRFKNELLASALDADDIWLLQRFCGSLLLGKNSAQRILLLTGTAGGGKSTLVEILERIIGLENVTELRTDYLNERFELFRYRSKTLLTGKDVPAEFLMRKGAPTLKKLVGNDLLTPEGKNSNGAFEMRGNFNVIITCNSRLRVRLEGDADAWRRRLMVIDYSQPKPKERIAEFGSVLIKEEASGILMWMLQGSMAHVDELRNSGDFALTTKQLARVENLLAESDSLREFVRKFVKPSNPSNSLTVDELIRAYEVYCSSRDFHPAAPLTVQKQLPDLMLELHGISKRNDIKRDDGTQRGFKGVEIDFDYES